MVFETGVHRSHQHAVRQRREAEVERREKMRKWAGSSRHRVDSNTRLDAQRCPDSRAAHKR
jgi:hypothetical protein